MFFRVYWAIESDSRAADLHGGTGKNYTHQIISEIMERDEDKGFEKLGQADNIMQKRICQSVSMLY